MAVRPSCQPDGNGEMTAVETAAAVGIDAADLRLLLRHLIEAGRVEQTGREAVEHGTG